MLANKKYKVKGRKKITRNPKAKKNFVGAVLAGAGLGLQVLGMGQQAKQQKEALRQQKRVNRATKEQEILNMSQENYQAIKPVSNNVSYAKGGMLPKSFNMNESDILGVAEDMYQVGGELHSNGGTPVDTNFDNVEDAELEKGEMIQETPDETRVYSDLLNPDSETVDMIQNETGVYVPKGTHADYSKKLGEMKNQNGDDRFKKSRELIKTRVDASLDILFNDQQMQNGNSQGDKMKYGGKLLKYGGGGRMKKYENGVGFPRRNLNPMLSSVNNDNINLNFQNQYGDVAGMQNVSIPQTTSTYTPVPKANPLGTSSTPSPSTGGGGFGNFMDSYGGSIMNLASTALGVATAAGAKPAQAPMPLAAPAYIKDTTYQRELDQNRGTTNRLAQRAVRDTVQGAGNTINQLKAQDILASNEIMTNARRTDIAERNRQKDINLDIATRNQINALNNAKYQSQFANEQGAAIYDALATGVQGEFANQYQRKNLQMQQDAAFLNYLGANESGIGDRAILNMGRDRARRLGLLRQYEQALANTTA